VATVVLDSSVLIALLSESDLHHAAAVKATRAKHEYMISAITLSEALISPFRTSSKLGNQIRQAIEKSVHRVIDIDSAIAALGAQVRAEKKMLLPDALISATATQIGGQLWSCDRALVKAHKGAVLIS